MEYITGTRDIHLENTAVALGKFDGLHRGHQILIEKIKIVCRQKFICRQVIFLFPVSNIKVEFYHISESIFIFIVYRYIQHKWHRGSTSGSPPFYRVLFWSMP